MAKVGFTTKDGTVVSFTTKKRASRKNATTALATRANKRKPAKRKPAARKPVKRTTVSRSSKDKATFKFYVVFRGPPKGLNIHAGFATQQAARAFITKKFKGTRRLQVRGRPGLVKSGHNPKVAANWKTFSLASSLKAMPAPRKRATRRNGGYLSEDALRRVARREREEAELAALMAESTEREHARRRKKGLTRKIKPVYSREYLEAKGMPRRNPESVPGEAQYILNEWASLVRESNAESPTERRARGSATHAMLLFQMIHEHQLQDYIRRYPEAYAAAMKRGGH
jgi:hypothetical protein